ncbi:hypothetical protein [Arthrobacter sp. efr-133-TYG-120]|uniref:hypothetical protein n=1 Tax=Arthrobacter sp. efr-133-TYG-120 TaxID=3040280 RepID=UPI00254E80BA|nr:hypothetical protein [Arthrobacter sp. efr-133-TYG-120]
MGDRVSRDGDHHDVGAGGITAVLAERSHVMARSCPAPREGAAVVTRAITVIRMDSIYSFGASTDEEHLSVAPRRLIAGAGWLMAAGFTTRISFGVAAIIAATNELMWAIGAAIALPAEQGNFHSGILVPRAGCRKASQPVSRRGTASDYRGVDREI